jgi:hypothetical protein
MGLARENVRMRTSKRRSWSIGSADSVLSIGSKGSILSIGSAGSILSIGSAGSVLSVGSAGSVASAFSAASVMSVGSMLSAFSRWSILAWRASNPTVLGQLPGGTGFAETARAVMKDMSSRSIA